MITPATEAYGLSDLFAAAETAASELSICESGAVRRTVGPFGTGQRVLDCVGGGVATCCCARFAGSDGIVRLEASGHYRLDACVAGGWLLSAEDSTAPGYWLPSLPMLRKLDDAGHVLSECPATIAGVQASGDQWAAELKANADTFVDCVVWQIPSGSNSLVQELTDLSAIETQRYYLWGSHDAYTRPADLYLHLIHGHVYETRFSWPKKWKICSENDAHALYTVLSGLQSATGKRLYRLLKEQLLLSVLDRQGGDGGWRHGEWSDRMESHFRLHCSAMHMLMDALAEKEDPAVRKALEQAAGFLARQTDKLDAGVWFLHDELERSVEALREGPFRWRPSRALGKSEANMLVLNSHLDATVALDRYRELTGDARHQPLVDQAVSATRAVLSLRPAEWLYGLLFDAIRLTFLPIEQATRLPLHRRALKRLAWKYLVPLLPSIKARWPRIVMPGGYIDRELSLCIFAHEYLPINLMDLLRYRRRFPGEPVDDVIAAAFGLVRDCLMFERWPEIKGKEYALGFWAEALYQACLVYPDAAYRASLAQAVIALESRGFGLPPSLLGANGEAVAPRHQVPTPLTEDARIRVVNLSRSGVVEVLLINCSSDLAHAHIARNAPMGLAWSVGADTERTDSLPRQIPARGWLWGRSRKTPGAAA